MTTVYSAQRDWITEHDDETLQFHCHPLAAFAYASDYPHEYFNTPDQITPLQMAGHADHYLQLGPSIEEFYRTEISTALVAKGTLTNWEVKVRDLLVYLDSHTVPTSLWSTATVLPLAYRFQQDQLKLFTECRSVDRCEQNANRNCFENVHLMAELVAPITMLMQSELHTDHDSFYMKTPSEHMVIVKVSDHRTGHSAFKTLCDCTTVTLSGTTTVKEHSSGFCYYEMIDPFVRA